MTTFTPRELKKSLSDGLLSFPITPFTDELKIDEPAFREHVSWLTANGASALFSSGGTGEFFSLTEPESVRLASLAVEAAGGQVPIIASAGYNLSSAVSVAKQAEQAGADGILLLPPYLVEYSQAGLIDYVTGVCRSTSLGVILYARASMRPSVESLDAIMSECPNLIGYKDGFGDVEQLVRLRTHFKDELLIIGGLPTAEVFATVYADLGISTYSSAVYNFIPEFALSFYKAVQEKKYEHVYAALKDFFIPFTKIRESNPGYAVALVKAGVRAVGRNAGPVRPPLDVVDESTVEQLRGLLHDNGIATA